MKKTKITLIIGFFILLPSYLNAFLAPTSDSMVINATGVNSQFKPPTLATENKLLTATEIEQLINTLTRTDATEDDKIRVLNKLSQIIADNTVNVALKEMIGDGLLAAFGNTNLSDILTIKIINLLRDVALTPNISPEKQQAIVNGLISGLNSDKSFYLKQKLLNTVIYLFSSRDNRRNFLIPLSIKEQAVDQLFTALDNTNLTVNLEESDTLKSKIIRLFRDIALTPGVSVEKQQAIVNGLINRLNSNTFSFYLKQKIVATLINLFTSKDNKGGFALPVSVKEQAVDALFTVVNNPNLTGQDTESEILKSKIIRLFRDIALTSGISPEKQQAIVNGLISGLNSDTLNFYLKQKLLNTVIYLFSSRDNRRNFLIPLSIKEQAVDQLFTALDNTNLTANSEESDILKSKIIRLFRDIALTSGVSAEKQRAIVIGLINRIPNEALSFTVKQKILEVTGYLISAKDDKKNFIMPLSLKEELADLLLSAFRGPNLTTEDTENDILKSKIIYMLRDIAVTLGINAEKQREIVIGLVNGLTNEALSFSIKQQILEATGYLMSAKYKKNFIIPLSLKEELADLLLSAFRGPNLTTEDVENDILKSKIIYLLRDIALTPGISAQKQQDITNTFLNSITGTGFRDAVKESSINALRSLLFDRSRTPLGSPLVADSLKEHIVDTLLGMNIFSNADLSDNIKEKVAYLFKDVVLKSNLKYEKKEALVQHLIASLGALSAELGEKIEVALSNIGSGPAVDKRIRAIILNKFLDIYTNNTDVSKRQLIASYLVRIGRVDPISKAEISSRLQLSGKQAEIWDKFGILVLNHSRDFSAAELTHIYDVLDNLSSESIRSIINSVSVFSAVDSSSATGWTVAGHSIVIGPDSYNPNDADGFLKFLSHEIAEAVYLQNQFESTTVFGEDAEEFFDLFEEYITDSQALINRAKGQSSTDSGLLLRKVKLIIQLFNHDASKKTYTFKIENGRIQRTEVLLDTAGLPK